VIADDLRAYLVAQADITAVVGTRIFEDEIPQTAISGGATGSANNIPCIVLTNTATQNIASLDGASGLVFESYEVECKSNGKAASNSLRGIVKPYLNGYTGQMGSKTALAVLIDDESVAVEEDVTGGDVDRYVSVLQITIQYLES
jgi:hypothetical protein